MSDQDEFASVVMRAVKEGLDRRDVPVQTTKKSSALNIIISVCSAAGTIAVMATGLHAHYLKTVRHLEEDAPVMERTLKDHDQRIDTLEDFKKEHEVLDRYRNRKGQ